MSYGNVPSPWEANLGAVVWDVMVEAYNKDEMLDIDEIASRAGIAPHLGQDTRRQYTRYGIHWARVLYQRSERMQLKCDRSGGYLYYLTDEPLEVREYSDDIIGDTLTRLRTMREGLEGVPTKTKIVRNVRKMVKRLVEDIEDEMNVPTTP